MEDNSRGVLALIIILLIVLTGLSIWGFMAKQNGFSPLIIELLN